MCVCAGGGAGRRTRCGTAGRFVRQPAARLALRKVGQSAAASVIPCKSVSITEDHSRKRVSARTHTPEETCLSEQQRDFPSTAGAFSFTCTGAVQPA